MLDANTAFILQWDIYGLRLCFERIDREKIDFSSPHVGKNTGAETIYITIFELNYVLEVMFIT